MSVLWDALEIPLHIGGILLFCGGFAIEIIVLVSLLWAKSPSDVEPFLRLVPKLKPVMITASAMVLVSGVAMAQHLHWGFHAWDISALILIAIMLPFAAAYKDPRLMLIRTAVLVDQSRDDRFSRGTFELGYDRWLFFGAFGGVGMFVALATVLMPTKPDLIGCIIWLAVGALAGLAIMKGLWLRSPFIKQNERLHQASSIPR